MLSKNILKIKKTLTINYHKIVRSEQCVTILDQAPYLSKFLDKIEFYKLDKAFFADEMKTAFHKIDFLGVHNRIIGFITDFTKHLIFLISNNP